MPFTWKHLLINREASWERAEGFLSCFELCLLPLLGTWVVMTTVVHHIFVNSVCIAPLQCTFLPNLDALFSLSRPYILCPAMAWWANHSLSLQWCGFHTQNQGAQRCFWSRSIGKYQPQCWNSVITKYNCQQRLLSDRDSFVIQIVS